MSEWKDISSAPVRKVLLVYGAVPGFKTPHTLRHTSASWMASAGVEMEQIARHLGHRDPMTTRTVYSKPEVESLRPGADVIDLRLKRKSSS